MILMSFRMSVVVMLSMFLFGCATPNQPDVYGETKLTARARSHVELGSAYYQQGKYGIALDEFNYAVQIDPQYGQAYNGLGLVYAALGEDAKADANFIKAVQVEPKSSESQNNYGIFLCERKRYDESIPHFLEAVKNPLYATPNLAYANAGICAARKKDIKNAEVYLNKALALQPLTYSAATKLAEIQFNRGNLQDAKQTLSNALVASPNAETLWLGYRISRAIGDKDSAASYALQLRQQFPKSDETRLMLSGQK
jgi:type IV pilus assembly protein PilF